MPVGPNVEHKSISRVDGAYKTEKATNTFQYFVTPPNKKILAFLALQAVLDVGIVLYLFLNA